MRWLMQEVDAECARRLSGELGVSPLLGRLLLLRGLAGAEEARRFLRPEIGHLHDPLQMRGMEAAVGRILQAAERGEKILVYGDYDVDGSLAAVILQTALTLLGAAAQPFIPHRMRDGYGMREEVLEQAQREGYSVVISVDTGIRAFGVVERARELGLDCIITDHHLPDTAPGTSHGIPRALAVLNPKQPHCTYPDKNLCGAGVAFKLVQALLEAREADAARRERLLASFLKLVAIGSIADSVPLVGENRVIAGLGLKGLLTPANHGLKALLEVAGLEGKAVSTVDVGFRLAPRINAAGRMESARDVIDLFTSAGPERAREIAEKLNRLNTERQQAEQGILDEIEKLSTEEPARFADLCLVLDGEGWHRGVIGIVASRMVDRFQRPALVIACEDGIGYGSGRSIERFHLLDALTACQEVFDRFGGHAQAAGFALPVERIPELRRRLNDYAASRLGAEDLVPELKIDAEISFSDLTPELLEELELLAPHGIGNPRPVFCAREARLLGQPRLLKEKHLKMQVTQQGRTITVVGWRKGDWIERLHPPDGSLDLAFHLGTNHYQNLTTMQLELLDLAVGSDSK